MQALLRPRHSCLSLTPWSSLAAALQVYTNGSLLVTIPKPELFGT